MGAALDWKYYLYNIMLSRVADSLFWLGRYVERADNLARLVQVSHFASLDYYHSEVSQKEGRYLLEATDSMEAYEVACKKAGGEEVEINKFMMMSPDNPDSIKQCIAFARENARMVRDQISEIMWLEINSIHLDMQSKDLERIWEEEPEVLLRKILRFSLLFQGLVHSTNLHDEGWDFLELGKFIERADKTSRILDTLTFRKSVARADLASVLNSCSGFSAFNSEAKGELTLEKVTNFLLCSARFPRSVRFCVQQMDDLLHAISGVATGQFSNEAERLTGKLHAQLNFFTQDDLADSDLHEFIDRLQLQLNSIGAQVYSNFVKLPQELDTTDLIRTPRASFQEQWQIQWQQQQQQQ